MQRIINLNTDMTNNNPIIALSGNEYSAAIKAMKSATDVINTQQELLKQQSAISAFNVARQMKAHLILMNKKD